MTVDNQVHVTTGTVKLKAEFANRDEQLFPNQFVNARLRLETRHSAILVPVAAIQRGTQGPFVYLVGHDQTVSIRPVTLGPFSGDVVAVDQGLATGDLVVIDGADKLRDGALIAVTTPSARDSTGKAAPVSNGKDAAAAEERTKRWLELDARIDRGEFGEEIRKLSEEERKQRMGWYFAASVKAVDPDNESVAPVHSAAGGYFAADGSDPAGRTARLSHSADIGPARG